MCDAIYDPLGKFAQTGVNVWLFLGGNGEFENILLSHGLSRLS
jgi:hypothetical protein